MAKVGTVRILYGVSTISLQVAVFPEYTLRALHVKEEEEAYVSVLLCLSVNLKVLSTMMFS